MFKNRLIAGLTSVAVITTASVIAVPTANAVQLHSEKRSGREICVATLSERETQISRDYFQKLLDEHAKLQEKLRDAFPQFEAEYAAVDERIAAGEVVNYSDLPLNWRNQMNDIDLYIGERELLFFNGTKEYWEYKRLAAEGFSITVEIAPGWTKDEMSNYPFENIAILPVGADWTRSEVSSKTISTYHALRNLYPGSEISSTVHTETARPYIQPHTYAITTIEEAFLETFHYNTLQVAANDCLASVDTSQLPPVETAPTTTYTPTVTVTAPAHTTTLTPEPSTVTAEPSTVVVEPAPTTTTVSPSTITEIPAPVTATAAPGTVIETAEPTTVTTTPSPSTVTAEPTTTTITPTPITATAEPTTVTTTPDPTTVTQTPAPVTATAAPGTITETAEPTTTTITPTPITATAEPTTVTTTATPSTITVTPTVMETHVPDGQKTEQEGGFGDLGIFAIVAAIFAIIGGAVAFMMQGII